MKSYLFCDNWTYKHLGGPGPRIPVTIPHDAMLSEPRTGLSAGGVNTGWYEGHDYLYEKRFVPGPESADQRLILEFEGVYRNAEVFLNGEKLIFRPYGYTNFYADITGKAKTGEETILEVIARNADQPNSRWYSGAGIYRPVRLWAAPREHIQMNGLRVRTVSIDPATVEVTVLTQGSGMVAVNICDSDTVVASAHAESNGKAVLTIVIPDGKLWSTETPNLYICKATFGEDSAETIFGVRSWTWGPHGLLLNGKRTILRGACIHHDNGVLVTCGVNIFFNFLSSVGFGVYSDEKAKKEAEKADRFRCTYEDGVLLAVSYDAAGKVLGRCVLHTASFKTELRAVPEEARVKPGRLSYIRLQYTDEDGIVKPLERGILNVGVTGGKLLGLGSACPYNEIGYLTGKTDTYFGEALAVVHAGEGEAIELTVTDGRHTGKAVVNISQNETERLGGLKE